MAQAIVYLTHKCRQSPEFKPQSHQNKKRIKYILGVIPSEYLEICLIEVTFGMLSGMHMTYLFSYYIQLFPTFFIILIVL
jgi:hypothetical protein